MKMLVFCTMCGNEFIIETTKLVEKPHDVFFCSVECHDEWIAYWKKQARKKAREKLRNRRRRRKK